MAFFLHAGKDVHLYGAGLTLLFRCQSVQNCVCTTRYRCHLAWDRIAIDWYLYARHYQVKYTRSGQFNGEV